MSCFPHFPLPAISLPFFHFPPSSSPSLAFPNHLWKLQTQCLPHPNRRQKRNLQPHAIIWKPFLRTLYSENLSTAEHSRNADDIDLRQSFAVDEAVMPVPAEVKSTSIVSSVPVKLFQKGRARIDRNQQESSRRQETFQVRKRSTKASRLSLRLKWTYQHRAQFSSYRLRTFHCETYGFWTSCTRNPALVESLNGSIFPTCELAFICEKWSTPLRCIEVVVLWN